CTAADVCLEYRTRTRLAEDVGVIGDFTHTLFADVRQLHGRPQNLGAGVNFDAARTSSRWAGTLIEIVMTSIRSSRIIAKGSENQRSAPKASAASSALCSLRVATAASFMPGRPLIAGTCETLAQLDLAFAPTIPTRISLCILLMGERSARPCADVKDDVSCLVMPTRHNAIDRGTMVS